MKLDGRGTSETGDEQAWGPAHDFGGSRLGWGMGRKGHGVDGWGKGLRVNGYVSRSELAARLGAERIALIEGPGGYGKTLLAGELRDGLELATVAVELPDDRQDPAGLVNELARA